MYLSSDDVIFLTLMSTILIIGFILNVFLLFLIIFKSPSNLTPYRFFLADTTISQILFCILLFLPQPRILQVGTSSVIINLGPVQFIGEKAAVYSYLGSMHMAWITFISIMLSMIYRYLSVTGTHLTTRTSILICIVSCVPPFLNYLICCQVITSNDPKIHESLVGHIVPNITQYNMVLSDDFSIQPKILIFMTITTAAYIPIYIVMFWCRYKIHKKLKETSAIQSATTKENVKRLVYALTIQSLCPLGSFVPAAMSNALSIFGVVDSSFVSYFIAPCLSFSCITDPVVSMTCIQPFRRYIMHRLNSDTQEVTQIKSVTLI